jgi:glucose/arabinose dehydrogenase
MPLVGVTRDEGLQARMGTAIAVEFRNRWTPIDVKGRTLRELRVNGGMGRHRRRSRVVGMLVPALAVSGLFLVPTGPIDARSQQTVARPAGASAEYIETVAGTGHASSSGNGEQAAVAEVSGPSDVAESWNGDILIADTGNNVIREIAPDSTISTAAGTGTAGFGGDGGAATAAKLKHPSGVSATPDGGFLIADTGNDRVRRVSPTGIITTVAGTGHACPSHPATSACGDGVSATKARLSGPRRVVALADGGFLVAEGNRVRMVTTSGTITRAAGTGVACARSTAKCGDGGRATTAKLNDPVGLAALPGGGFLIADAGDHRVRAVSASGRISTIAGSGVSGAAISGTATRARLAAPNGVAVTPDGSVVVSDSSNDIVALIRNGQISTLAGNVRTACTTPANGCGDNGPAVDGRLHHPDGLFVSPAGEVLVSDALSQRIREIFDQCEMSGNPCRPFLGENPTATVKGPSLVLANEKLTLANGAGYPIHLRGINFSAFDDCTWDTSHLTEAPTDQASIDAMETWKINVVRLALNEDCWLGINGLPMYGTGAQYQSAVETYIDLLRNSGLYVLLTMENFAPGSTPSNGIDDLPDADHAPAFWTGVATAFRADHGVFFDPVNELGMDGYDNPSLSASQQWSCWLNGCTVDSLYDGTPYQAVGIQSLVTTIRSTGATQPIILGGLAYNSDLSQLLTHLPTDPTVGSSEPLNQLMASAHIYDFGTNCPKHMPGDAYGYDPVQLSCAKSETSSLVTSELRPIAAQMPVMLGELGEQNCDSQTAMVTGGDANAAFTTYVLTDLVDPIEQGGIPIGVLEWEWTPNTLAPGSDGIPPSPGSQCPTMEYGQGGPLLIEDYDGTPTVMGAEFKAWIASQQ